MCLVLSTILLARGGYQCEIEWSKFNFLSPAQVVELVDTLDLGSGSVRCGGPSPLLGNFPKLFLGITISGGKKNI